MLLCYITLFVLGSFITFFVLYDCMTMTMTYVTTLWHLSHFCDLCDCHLTLSSKFKIKPSLLFPILILKSWPVQYYLYFSSSILILSGLIITLKNLTFFTFYLYFSNFIHKLFSANLFTVSSTTSLCSFSFSVHIITSLIKLPSSLVLIKSYRISFIIV